MYNGPGARAEDKAFNPTAPGWGKKPGRPGSKETPGEPKRTPRRLIEMRSFSLAQLFDLRPSSTHSGAAQHPGCPSGAAVSQVPLLLVL